MNSRDRGAGLSKLIKITADLSYVRVTHSNACTITVGYFVFALFMESFRLNAESQYIK